MKVTTWTPELLIVEDRPVLTAVFLSLFVLAFTGAGLAMLSAGEAWGLLMLLLGGGVGPLFLRVFVRRVQVVFHRPEGWVEIRRKSLAGASRERHRLDEIDRAELEQSAGSEGGSVWRVVLVIGQGQSRGRHPLTEVYTSGEGQHHAAAVINRWLAEGRPPREAQG